MVGQSFFFSFVNSFLVAVRGPVPIIRSYELTFIEKLAESNSGKVYKGRYNGTIVAIKILSGYVSNKTAVEKFRQESFMTSYGVNKKNENIQNGL